MGSSAVLRSSTHLSKPEINEIAIKNDYIISLKNTKKDEDKLIEIKEVEKYGNIPISIKFRHGFYYDDEMKKKKATVSMQAYTPKYNYIKINRYKGAGIGFGQRNTLAPKIGPGPGEYKIPRIFERGVKKDLAIN